VGALLQELWRRLGQLPSSAAQAAFLKGVVGDLVKVTYGRMLRILRQAEVFNDLVSPE
jgi:hypothetical protein